MRVIRLKIKPEVKLLLLDAASRFAFNDSGFVEDVYALLRFKGSGLPDDARCKLMSSNLSRKYNVSALELSILIRKRRQVFRELTALPYFMAVASTMDAIAGTERLLSKFKGLHHKFRESQCKACLYKPECSFGKQYGGAVTDISKVVDPDYKRKAHPQCPALPQMDMHSVMNSMQQVMNQLLADATEDDLKMMEKTMPNAINVHPQDVAPLAKAMDDLAKGLDAPEDSSAANHDPEDSTFVAPASSGFSKCDTYNATHSGNALVKLNEHIIDSLSSAQLLLMDLGRKFDVALSKAKKGKFAPVAVIGETQQPDTMKRISDISKLTGSQYGLPDEVFDKKLNEKSLVKRQDKNPESKKQLLYILHDNSGSMCGQLGDRAKNGMLTRGALAGTFSLALARRVRDDGGYLFHRFFAGRPSPLKAARHKDDFEEVMRTIAMSDYNGGGTSIIDALTTAASDILAAKDELARAEILIISDAEDSFDEAAARTAAAGLEVNVLDVSGSSFGMGGGARSQLKKIATKYFKADETAVDIDKIVNLI